MEGAESTDLLRARSLSLDEVEKLEPGLYAQLRKAWIASATTAVTTRLPKKPRELREALTCVTADIAVAVFDKGGAVAAAIEAHLASIKLTEKACAAARDWLAAVAGDLPSVDRSLPLGQWEVLAESFRRAELAATLDAATLSSEEEKALRARVDDAAALDDAVLDALVESGQLASESAKRLGIQLTVARLIDDPLAAPRVLAAMPGARAIRELATYSAATWTETLQKAQVGDEKDRSDLAERIAGALAARFAGTALTSEIARRTPPPTVEAVERGPDDQHWKTIERLHPGLGIGSILRSERSSNEKASQIAKRLQGFDLAIANLPELVGAALSEEAVAKAAPSLEPDDRGAVLKTLHAYQRVLRVTGEPEGALIMLLGGSTSATEVANGGTALFEMRSGASGPAAQTIVSGALSVAREAARPLWFALDGLLGGFGGTSAPFLGPGSEDYLRGIDGVGEIFGHGSECECEHCKSVLSPAAYFVDLLDLIEERILAPTFGGDSSSPLHLKKRRPDLWTFPLTCESTHDDVSYLELIIRVLSRYVAASRGREGLDDAALRSLVFGEILADSVSSPKQPFERAHCSAELALSSFDLSRAEVARRIGVDTDLSITPRQARLITGAETVVLGEVFELTVPATGTLGPVPTDLAVAGTGLSRAELEEALGSQFVSSAGAVTFRATRSEGAVQNDGEEIVGLKEAILVRLHRFIRLKAQTEWTIRELDLLVEHAGGTLDGATLDRILLAGRMAVRLRLDVETQCALLGSLPVRSANPDEPAPPGARLFGAGSSAQPALPGAAVVTYDGSAALDARLMRGLGLDAASLHTLLAAHGASPRLDAATLGSLLRHASVARGLHLSVGDLFRALRLAGIGERLRGLEDVAALVEWIDWLRASPWSLDDVETMLGTELTAADEADAARIVELAAQEGRLTFAPTVLALVPDVPEAASVRIFSAAENAGRFVSVGPLYRLSDGFDFGTPLAVDAGLAAQEPAMRELLRSYAPDVVFARLAAEALRATSEEVTAWLSCMGASSATLASALADTGQAAALLAGLRRLSRGTRGLNAAEIALLARHREVFALSTGRVLASTLRAIARYRALRTERLDIDGWDRLLESFAAGRFTDLEALGLALDVEELDALQRALGAGPTASLDALARMEASCALARALGVSPPTVVALATSEGAALDAAADELWARVPDPAPGMARMLTLERDALIDYLLRALRAEGDGLPPFESTDDLYGYFLLDVELESCARTTELAAAISSLQLYVQRCRMGLEQDRRADDDPAKVRAVAAISDGEWAWRRSYRLWEANRKVFLFPEAYLEPSLRDDKTPLFAALEDELLQARDVDEQAVLDAYARYLAGFEEIATLTVAGSYFDDGADVLHLFGASASDPPIYYYRSVEGLARSERAEGGAIWHPWRKLEVQIPARKVSAIVYKSRLILFWVSIQTQSQSEFRNGSSVFTGYKHTLSIECTWMRPDGSWTTPQKLGLDEVEAFSDGTGVITDPIVGIRVPGTTRVDRWAPLLGSVQDTHSPQDGRLVPRDGYTLKGPRWERVYPHIRRTLRGLELQVYGRDFAVHQRVDLLDRRLKPPSPAAGAELLRVFFLARTLGGGERVDELGARAGDRVLYASEHTVVTLNPYALAATVLDEAVFSETQDLRRRTGRPPPRPTTPLVGLPREAALDIVPGAAPSATLRLGDSTVLLTDTDRDGSYVLHRLGSALVDDLRERLFDGGIGLLLDIETQLGLQEPDAGVTASSSVEDRTGRSVHEWAGPLGTYWREIFLHIPFLLATHLSSQGRFETAQRWFHFIFDPTAAGSSGDHASERVWRYAGFRGLTPDRLREQLEDASALAAYEKDPFNPHAIARLRPTAYAKAVLLRYVENLIAWGDSLFVQFTRESVNEATQLYVMARALLGKTSTAVPDCGEADEVHTYEAIAPSLDAGTEVLVESETWVTSKSRKDAPPKYTLSETASKTRKGVRSSDAGSEMQLRDVNWSKKRALHAEGRDRVLDVTGGGADGSLELSLIRQLSLVFCVPASPKLKSLRELIADRLFKIRHCQDIDGNTRVLAPFAPPIDPALLVAARVAGLSLDDVLVGGTGRVPPYRFAFLVERAKGHAAAMAGIGSALLAALEKKDGEELTRLRLIHQKNLLALTRRVREDEVEAAHVARAALEKRRDAITYRHDFYASLLDQGLDAGERAAQTLRGAALALRVESAALNVASAIVHLVPQLGAPTAMKYGGLEIGSSLGKFSSASSAVAGVTEAMAGAASTASGYLRRTEGWEHQRALAEHELAQIERELAASEIRIRIAERAREIHDETERQADEVYERYQDKLTGLGLYTFMSAELSRLYRDAFEAALSLARLAERALRYERGDEAPVLGGDYWEAGFAGLLAGERLLFDLNRLEAWFVETHHRKLEVDQTFALSQIAPEALWALKETNQCSFALPKLFFDLVYPGQYNRRIRAVRLTIPAVVPPYANIGATLELDASEVCRTPGDSPDPIPPQHTARIATSTGQNDAGVFELSFGDARYLPFEGAGAVSTWTLRLPSAVRSFDYHSIDDVLVRVAYTADYDETLRTTLEAEHGQLVARLRAHPFTRVISFRRELGGLLRRLQQSPLGTGVPFEVKLDHYPFLLQQAGLSLTSARLALVPAHDGSIEGLTLRLGETSASTWLNDPTLGLPASVELKSDLAGVTGTHRIAVMAPSERPLDAMVSDILLVLEVAAGPVS